MSTISDSQHMMTGNAVSISLKEQQVCNLGSITTLQLLNNLNQVQSFHVGIQETLVQ